MRRTSVLALVLTAIVFSTPSAWAVTMDWVTVANPGNVCDPQPQGCFGSVSSVYRISKYEVTYGQYTEFLNAVATTDPRGLYNTSMDSALGGIQRSGSPGSYTYSSIAGRESKPVNYVSFYDALRFTNWLGNGQGSGDTETGGYTLLGGTATPSNGAVIARNALAFIFLPSENEWYKAAYYDAASISYNPYPFADGLEAVCQSPAGTTAHSANCFAVVGSATDVGAYTSSPSDYGTFDQGGNVWEMNEEIVGPEARGMRGGIWNSDAFDLAAFHRSGVNRDSEEFHIGFRVASLPVPEPASSLLVVMSLLGVAWLRIRLRV